MNGEVANYGCESHSKDEHIVLMGDLKVGSVWTAKKAILSQAGVKWVIKSSEEVLSKIVWQ